MDKAVLVCIPTDTSREIWTMYSCDSLIIGDIIEAHDDKSLWEVSHIIYCQSDGMAIQFGGVCVMIANGSPSMKVICDRYTQDIFPKYRTQQEYRLLEI